MWFNLKRVSGKFLSSPQSPLIIGCVDVKWITPSVRFTQIPESLIHLFFLHADSFQHKLVWDVGFSRSNVLQVNLQSRATCETVQGNYCQDWTCSRKYHNKMLLLLQHKSPRETKVNKKQLWVVFTTIKLISAGPFGWDRLAMRLRLAQLKKKIK